MKDYQITPSQNKVLERRLKSQPNLTHYISVGGYLVIEFVADDHEFKMIYGRRGSCINNSGRCP
jgi:hypothetical protein